MLFLRLLVKPKHHGFYAAEDVVSAADYECWTRDRS
jgi:hypothetical protein